MPSRVRSLRRLYLALALFILTHLAVSSVSIVEAQSYECVEFPETGFLVCDEGTVQIRRSFDRDYGVQRAGYPISGRFAYQGFVTQAFQKLILQWRPDERRAVPLNTFDELSQQGWDALLHTAYQVPFPATFDEAGKPWPAVVRERQALLNARPALRRAYFAVGDPLLVFGLPTSHIEDMGNHYAIRTQRAVLQEWKESVPWARRGQVTIANGGDMAKALGFVPLAAQEPGYHPLDPQSTGFAPLRLVALDPDAEWVEIGSPQDAAHRASLLGWRLQSGDGRATDLFDVTLGGGATCRVTTNQLAVAGCGNFVTAHPVWETNGCAYLRDPAGGLQDYLCYGPQPPVGCPFKATGGVFFDPTHPRYSDVALDPRQGGRWLCSADDAQRSGFRPAAR